jgi:tRNA-Thr(GGU) m(6)t(6)A37 methyltransferase TsaA
MDTITSYLLRPVGVVRSSIRRRADAPRQGSAGGPRAHLEIHPPFFRALDGITVGQEIFVLTWLHQADRETLQVRPRSDPANAWAGVFATRSPDRPNPIGLHRVTVLMIDASGLLALEGLEPIDGTPVIDLKPVRNWAKDS